LAFYRHLYRRLPFFTLYLALLPAKAAVVWLAYQQWGYTSSAAWYAYWCAEVVVFGARGLVIAELCWVSLRKYPGLWSFTRRGLIIVALVLLSSAAIAATQSTHRLVAFVLAVERGLELASSVILILLFAISVRYRVWLEPMERNIVLGLALYSTVEMLNSTFMTPRLAPYFPWWESVRVGCFDVGLVLWLLPLLRPLPVPAPAPALLSKEATGHLLHRLLERMRELAAELKRVGKAIRK
jgi:hypothetical protein